MARKPNAPATLPPPKFPMVVIKKGAGPDGVEVRPAPAPPKR